MNDKNSWRLHRQFLKLERQVPMAARVLIFLRQPKARLVRIPLGIFLIIGGIFSFLPVLGVWMLPLGLLLLAIDLPFLQPSVNWGLVRGRRRLSMWRRRKRKPEDPPH